MATGVFNTWQPPKQSGEEDQTRPCPSIQFKFKSGGAFRIRGVRQDAGRHLIPLDERIAQIRIFRHMRSSILLAYDKKFDLKAGIKGHEIPGKSVWLIRMTLSEWDVSVIILAGRAPVYFLLSK